MAAMVLRHGAKSVLELHKCWYQIIPGATLVLVLTQWPSAQLASVLMLNEVQC